MLPKPIALLVHGGAGSLRPEAKETTQSGISRALDRGWGVLAAGGAAFDACEEAIRQLEDDPVFNAGFGACLNRDGKAQLDAVLMDGATLRAGAVCAVERIRNPIQLARQILERDEHVLFAGPGAEAIARRYGMSLCDPRDLISPDQLQRWNERKEGREHLGTVGAVALDRLGNLAAGTSTGGTFFKYAGRVGDSPLIGCGCFADNESAAVSCTGHGESIMKIVMAKAAADAVASGQDAQQAAEIAVAQMRPGPRAPEA